VENNAGLGEGVVWEREKRSRWEKATFSASPGAGGKKTTGLGAPSLILPYSKPGKGNPEGTTKEGHRRTRENGKNPVRGNHVPETPPSFNPGWEEGWDL